MRTLLVLVMLLLASPVMADLTIVATTPTTNTDGSPITTLAGITIHVRIPPAAFSSTPTVTIPITTVNTEVTYTLVSNQTVTYCAVAYAYNNFGIKSNASNEECKKNEDKRIPSPPILLRISTLSLGPTTYASTTIGTSRYKAISATNTSPSPMTVTNIELLGPDPDFRMATYTLPRIVAAYKSTSFRVYFEPVEAGTRYSIFRVTTNAGQQDVPLSGIGKM